MTGPSEGALAETRVFRTIVTVWGTSSLVFLALGVSTIVAEAPDLVSWWNVLAITLVFAPPPVLVIVSRYLELGVLRGIMTAYAVAYAVVVVTFVPAMLVDAMPDGLAPWPLGVTGLGTVAAALAWRPTIAWIYLLFHVAAMGVVRFMGGGQLTIDIALQDALFSFAFDALFTALAVVSIRGGRAVDSAAAAAAEAAARASSASARVRERARLDALVHDEVMTTLFYATVGTPELDNAVSRQARKALDQLRAHGEFAAAQQLDAAEFVSRLRSATVAQSNRVQLGIEGQRSGDVPLEVASAFAEAAAEAVRNSLAYSSNVEPVLVSLRLDERALEVTIADKGVGFNPRAVPAHRLGIKVSIEGRLAIVPGCVATVQSGVGQGTRVLLRWSSA